MLCFSDIAFAAPAVYHVKLPDGGGHSPIICRRTITCPR